MPWDVKRSDNRKYIEIRYSGVVTMQELIAALNSVASLSRNENIFLVLADLTEMTGGHSVFDLYGLITMYENVGLSPQIKEAIIMPELTSTREEVHFYETACLNQGFLVRVFVTREEALSWLNSWWM